MTAHWMDLADAADTARRQAGQLWTQSLATRCPFVLGLAASGKPLGYGDDFRCDKDVHTLYGDNDGHHLAIAVWVRPEVA